MGHKFGAYIVGPDQAAPFKEHPDQGLHCMLFIAENFVTVCDRMKHVLSRQT